LEDFFSGIFLSNNRGKEGSLQGSNKSKDGRGEVNLFVVLSLRSLRVAGFFTPGLLGFVVGLVLMVGLGILGAVLRSGGAVFVSVLGTAVIAVIVLVVTILSFWGSGILVVVMVVLGILGAVLWGGGAVFVSVLGTAVIAVIVLVVTALSLWGSNSRILLNIIILIVFLNNVAHLRAISLSIAALGTVTSFFSSL